MMIALQSIAAFVLITLPWLNPFTIGPSSAMVPLWFSWVCVALLLLVWASTGHRRPADVMVRAIVTAWLVAATCSAVIGLLQYFKATDAWWPWINVTGGHAAFGNLRQRNLFASLLNIGLAALLWWVSHWPVTAPGRPAGVPFLGAVWGTVWGRVGLYGRLAAAVLVAVLIGSANAASASRTGLFQWLMVTALALYWRRIHPVDAARSVWVPRLLWVLALSYLGATVLLPWLADQMLPSGGAEAASALARLRAGDSICSSRLTLWGNVLHLISQRPWTGWGWGNLDYAHFITLYTGHRFCDILDNAHNLPLHLAVELGIPVAVTVCGGVVWLIWRASPWRETDPTRQLVWAVLSVIGLHSLLEYPLWYGPFQMATGLCIYLLVSSSRAVDAAPESPPRRSFWPYGQALLSLVLLMVCVFVWGEYWRASQIYLPPEQRMTIYKEDTLRRTSDVWLFRDHVRFAELTMSSLRPDNAAHINSLAKELLHFSPEPRVAQLLVASAIVLDKPQEAEFYAERFRAAFPQAYASWLNSLPDKLP